MNLCDERTIRELLGRHGFHFSKSMGQNFLIDPQIPAEIAAAFSAQPSLGLVAVGLVVFSTVAPYILYTRGLSQVEAGRASIMASLEPVVASLAGVLLFQEPMSALTAGGIGCVLAGVYILR